MWGCLSHMTSDFRTMMNPPTASLKRPREDSHLGNCSLLCREVCAFSSLLLTHAYHCSDTLRISASATPRWRGATRQRITNLNNDDNSHSDGVTGDILNGGFPPASTNTPSTAQWTPHAIEVDVIRGDAAKRFHFTFTVQLPPTLGDAWCTGNAEISALNASLSLAASATTASTPQMGVTPVECAAYRLVVVRELLNEVYSHALTYDRVWSVLFCGKNVCSAMGAEMLERALLSGTCRRIALAAY